MREQIGFLMLFIFSEMSLRYFSGVLTGIVIASKFDFKPIVNYAEVMAYSKYQEFQQDYEKFTKKNEKPKGS